MNINLTLVIQMIVFAVLVWFMMRFVWPLILGPLEERSRKIALGLAAADKGQEELAQAHERAGVIVREARERANQIIEHAQHRANELVEEAKGTAQTEGARIVAAAHEQIELDTVRAKDGLRREVAGIAVRAAGKLLGREIDARAHADLLDKLAEQV
ncbi:MAG TPA: F0F1 ATP synthase subunit B [Steroidobacteraceae bacterium]|nr:F0F1 ATP synthase subunit B [Steroidobacteraceae bacterium]